MSCAQIGLKNIIVQFEIPYVLMLPDSMKKESVTGEYKDYVFLIEDIHVMIRSEKKLKDLGGVMIATEDMFGRLNNSIIQIWFDSQFINKYNIENFRNNIEIIKEFTLKAFNQFVKNYALVMGSFWIFPLTDAHVAHFTFIGIDQEGNQDPFTQGTLGTGKGLGSNIDKEKDELLRKLILNENKVDDLQTLSFSASRYLMTEDYNIAILLIEILFEAKYAQMIRKYFENKGLSSDKIDKKFEDKKGYPLSITSFLRNIIKEEFTINIDNNNDFKQKYNNWSNFSREYRNDVAHGKNIKYSYKEAMKAFKGVSDMLNFLFDLFNEEDRLSIYMPNTKTVSGEF